MTDLRLWDDSAHFRAGAQLGVLPRGQDDRTHEVMVVNDVRTRGLGGGLFAFQYHRHCVHRHQSVPRHHHRCLFHLKWFALETQRD